MGNVDGDFWRKGHMLGYIKSALLLTTGGMTAQRELMSVLGTTE